jgi:hypothetical protein
MNGARVKLRQKVYDVLHQRLAFAAFPKVECRASAKPQIVTASAALSPSRPCHRRARITARRGFGFPAVYANFSPGSPGLFFGANNAVRVTCPCGHVGILPAATCRASCNAQQAATGATWRPRPARVAVMERILGDARPIDPGADY